jgi:hypothetical protein
MAKEQEKAGFKPFVEFYEGFLLMGVFQNPLFSLI